MRLIEFFLLVAVIYGYKKCFLVLDFGFVYKGDDVQ
jgi:hypothetical protein